MKIPTTVQRYATQISVDQNGSVLASSPSGLIGIIDGKPRILSSRNGLPCDDAMGFTPDRQGAFWIYMACGLARISDSELQRWLQDPATNVNPKVLDVFDGVRTGRAPFSPMALSTDGRVWFANGFSVGMVDPARLVEKAAPPPVHIESVIADHKTFSLKQSMRLPALTRDLEIDYTALSLGAPQKVYFRYRLEGRESDWQQPGTRRQAYYTDLRPGSYTFRVIACNSDGVWNEAGDTLAFSIDSAYYQTNWFRAALVAAFFLATLGVIPLAPASARAGVQRESGRPRGRAPARRPRFARYDAAEFSGADSRVPNSAQSASWAKRSGGGSA